MFLPCVLVTSAHEPRGGARFLIFGGQIRGGERLVPNVSAKHGGQMGVKYVGPCFFLAQGRFLGVPFLHLVAAGHAEQTKKK